MVENNMAIAHRVFSKKTRCCHQVEMLSSIRVFRFLVVNSSVQCDHFFYYVKTSMLVVLLCFLLYNIGRGELENVTIKFRNFNLM